mgnify:CR=1 FL=1
MVKKNAIPQNIDNEKISKLVFIGFELLLKWRFHSRKLKKSIISSKIAALQKLYSKEEITKTPNINPVILLLSISVLVL